MATPPPLPPRFPAQAPPASAAPPLAYAAPMPHTTSAPRVTAFPFAWGVFLWAEGIMLAWVAIMLFVLPRFAEVFADFKTELPPVSKTLFAVRSVVAAGGWVVLLAIPVGLGLIVGRAGPGGRRLARTLVTLAFAIFIVLTILAIAQPLTVLMDGLGTAGGKK